MSENVFYPKEYKLEAHKPVFACLSDGGNEYITETAGFVPLEVKLKQFEQNGLRAQFNESEFTSSDYRDMYLNPDFEIYPGDELEEVQEKVELQRKYIIEKLEMLKEKNKAASDSVAAAAPQAPQQNDDEHDINDSE